MPRKQKPNATQLAKAVSLRILAHEEAEKSEAALARGENRTALIHQLRARNYADRAEMYENGVGK